MRGVDRAGVSSAFTRGRGFIVAEFDLALLPEVDQRRLRSRLLKATAEPFTVSQWLLSRDRCCNTDQGSGARACRQSGRTIN